MTPMIALLALLIEATFGYSQRLVGRIGHPVIWIGRLIGRLDAGWNQPGWGFSMRRWAGIAAVVVLFVAAGGTGWLLQSALLQSTVLPGPFGIVIAALLASSLLAQRSLYEHVARVASAMEQGGLDGGRQAVAHIVGRDPLSLDEAGVARAAIESLAENFSDGVVAPALWLAAAGLPGCAIYKAVNTADSMIGHRTPRHEAFGWAAARLDDVLNLPASRLSALLIMGAAALVPGADAGGAWRAVRRDAALHRSPNAGWPEAAMAGALGLALAGPRRYGGVLVDDVMMGDGRRAADARDIRAALRLYLVADALMIALLLLGLVVILPG